jgi:hypothetical protein
LVNDTIIQKTFHNSTAMAKGHLDQHRKNIQSTKPLAEEDADDVTTVETTNHRTNFVYATIGVIHVPTGQVYTNQTGQFPVDSNEGHKYMMILYDYDSNAILTAPLKDRKGPTIKHAFEQLHRLLVQKGYQPKLQKLDNEALIALKEFMLDEGIEHPVCIAGMPLSKPSAHSKITSLQG